MHGAIRPLPKAPSFCMMIISYCTSYRRFVFKICLSVSVTPGSKPWLPATRGGDVVGMAGAACLQAGGPRQTGMFVWLAGKLSGC